MLEEDKAICCFCSNLANSMTISRNKMELTLVVRQWQFCCQSLTLRISVVENQFQAGAVPNQFSINLEVVFFFFPSLKTSSFKSVEASNYVLLLVYFPLQ